MHPSTEGLGPYGSRPMVGSVHALFDKPSHSLWHFESRWRRAKKPLVLGNLVMEKRRVLGLDDRHSA